MDAVISLVERFWHNARMKWILPVGVLASSLLLSTGWATAAPTALQLVVAGILATLVTSVWYASHTIPKADEDKVGIVVSIAGETEEHDKQVQADFVASLRRLLEEDAVRTHFQIIVLPRYLAQECTSRAIAAKHLERAGALFMVYGSVRKRQIRNEDSHFVELQGIVSHGPVPKRVSDQLAADFQVALPRRIIFPQNNDALSFELTSDVTGIAARYVIGLAALVSGDPEYAEILLLSVETRIKSSKTHSGQLRAVAASLPSRLSALYTNWLDALADAYLRSRAKEYLQQAEGVVNRLLQRNPKSYKGMLMRAICCFELRRDVAGAKRALRACREVDDPTWRYNLAFIYSYEGRLDDALAEYRRAFSRPLVDLSIPVQCEEFIQGVLMEEPGMLQLHYAAALINERAKEDSLVALREYNAFVNGAESDQFSVHIQLAREAIVRLSAVEQNADEAA